jgi:SET domain-containing protein
MKTNRSPLYIRKARGMGRGVFAGRAYRKGEVIEVCPVLVLPPETEEKGLGGLAAYVFAWGAAGDRLAIALGYGSLYNHSPDPNADFAPRHGRGELVFRATGDITAGEQILIDYRWAPADCAAFGLPALLSPLPARTCQGLQGRDRVRGGVAVRRG